jgi:hypothetical protein
VLNAEVAELGGYCFAQAAAITSSVAAASPSAP